MFKIKTYNKISKSGLEVFDDKYTIGDEVENADGAIVRSAALHDTEFPETLKAIARAGAGTNNIPIERCSEQGIVVFNTPGANANAVKELVIAGLLISSRRVISGIEWAKTLKGEGDAVGKLVEKGKGAFAGPEIKGKKLGVIGLGAIGVMVANAANHLGMTVYGYDPYLSVKSAWNLNHNAVYINDINEIFANCDYISVHVPLTDSTKNLINAESIAKMKDGVRILNFSRAALVDDTALKAALESGKVAAYVTDFPTDAILDVDGVIAIPHLGASTPESEDNCASMAAKELIDYIENGN
ncbi:MAG: 3-phosphoglycerate dehydrogenase, partial [Clostridia bacterium]|nr:3-phosphoglycerate dehydrogenase [Clostridia bacterium]